MGTDVVPLVGLLGIFVLDGQALEANHVVKHGMQLEVIPVGHSPGNRTTLT